MKIVLGVLIGLCALAALGVSAGFLSLDWKVPPRPEVDTTAPIRNPEEHFPESLFEGAMAPEFESTIDRSDRRRVAGTRVTYSKGGAGFVEIGDTRLVFPGMDFTSRSSGGLVLSSSSTAMRSSGQTSIGEVTFTDSYENGETVCTFVGTTFRLVQGYLYIEDVVVDVIDAHKQAVLVDFEGKTLVADIP